MFKREDTIEICLSKLNGNNSFHLISPNGIDKTTFLKQLLDIDKENRKINQIYLDLFYVSSIKQFYISVLEKSQNLLKEKSKSKNKINRIFYGDDLEKLNQLEESELLGKFIDLIKYLSTKKRNTVIVFDQFQLVNQLLSKDKILSLFESLSEFNKVQFIFSGTQNMILFENLESVNLIKLDTDTLKRSIAEKFDKEKIVITKKSINLIIDWSKGDTSVITFICSRLLQKNLKKIKTSNLKLVLNELISEKLEFAHMLRGLLSVYQWRLLVSIAKEGVARQVTSKDYIAKYELNAPSSVKTALKALIEKSLITQNGTSYTIVNVILMKALSKQQ